MLVHSSTVYHLSWKGTNAYNKIICQNSFGEVSVKFTGSLYQFLDVFLLCSTFPRLLATYSIIAT